MKFKNNLVFKLGILTFFALTAFFLWPMLVWAAPDLIINEVMYDLPGADDKHEWIELFNAGSSEIDLTGWKFNDGDSATNHALNAPPKNGSRGSLVLPAGGYLLLTGDAAFVAVDLPGFSGSIIDTVMSLANSSATLKIINKDEQEVCSAFYSKEIGAGGNGKTLEWDGAQLKESFAEGGTPGAPNSVLNPSYSPAPTVTPSPTPAGSAETTTPVPSTSQTVSPAPAYQYSKEIFINEFLPSPRSGEKEWVEIFNTGEQPVNLTGWQIADSANIDRPQLIPENTIIGPKEFLVIVFEKQILNNDGDQVKLLWPDNQILHAISYQKALPGFSCVRLVSGQWVWTNQPTPGQDNKESFWETIDPVTDESPLPSVSPRQEEVALIKSLAKTSPLRSVLADNETPSPQSSEPAGKINLIAAGEAKAERTNAKTLLWLLIIFVLSSLAALGLIYFKRRQNLTIDSKKTDDKM